MPSMRGDIMTRLSAQIGASLLALSRLPEDEQEVIRGFAVSRLSCAIMALLESGHSLAGINDLFCDAMLSLESAFED